MTRTLDVICVVCGILQILQVDARVRHNEELLGPLRSIEAPQDEFGRAARRGRIDILGLILKKRIAHLRRAGQTELVFLVDSSASVGSDNFYNEIKFIRKVPNISKSQKPLKLISFSISVTSGFHCIFKFYASRGDYLQLGGSRITPSRPY